MKRTLLASALAFTALGSAQAAHAQSLCVAPADAGDALVYVMPTAYDATIKRCKGELGNEAFLTSENGKAYIETFRTRQDDSWDGTYRFAKVFMAARAQEGGGDDGVAKMLEQMEPEQLRPFVDALLSQMISEQIKSDSCDKIDRGARLLSPLPVENVSGLLEFVLEFAKLENPPVCKVGEATTGHMDEPMAATAGE